MKKIILYICMLPMLFMTSCEDYLDKKIYEFTDDTFWTSEPNLRAYCQEFYPYYFSGYLQDFMAFGGYFSGDLYNDDYLMAILRDEKFYFPVDRTKSTGTWTKSFEYIRKANLMIARIDDMPVEQNVKEHWMAVGRMFRAVAYSIFVSEYGDVPYIDFPVEADDYATLYKPRDSRLFVVDKIQEDFEYAIKYMRLDDGTLQANRYLAGAMMSRWMLYHATWFKYHGTTVGPTSTPVDNATLKKYFDASIAGADVVMNSGKFSIGNTYNELFSSATLKGNPEVIFYREYVETILPNALMAYNAGEDQTQGGLAQSAVDAYLCNDGLPISQSPKYKGASDPRIKAVFTDRDPRLTQTLVDTIRVTNGGIQGESSFTGYATKKFLNEVWLAEKSRYTVGRQSIADAPDVRYAEVLLNYVEARYELSLVGGSTFEQKDLDLTINKIRGRNLVKWGETDAKSMPTVTLSGTQLAVNGVIINDLKRDPSVDPILWEIRRERRVELMMEGNRNRDLNRWAKYEYLVSGVGEVPNTTLLGSWIKRSDYPRIKIGDLEDGVNLYNPTGDATQEGYIYPFRLSAFGVRAFVKGDIKSERNYLRAVPLNEINIYERNGYKLEQNPGW